LKSESNDIAIFWFRRDLRLNDNTALYFALQSGFPVLPVFIFDTNILNELQDKKDKRVFFIHQQLKQLKSDLEKAGSTLAVLHTTPLSAFEKLFAKYSVKVVYTNHDYEPYGIKRDNEIKDFLGEKNITFNSCKDQVIFEKDEILKSDGTPYTIFTPYANAWKQRFDQEEIKLFNSENCLSALFQTEPLPFPSLEEIGFEKVSLAGMPLVNIDQNLILEYKNTRNFPGEEGTSGISTHLRFGTISIRFVAKLANSFSETWLNELIWREFFMMILYHFPEVVTENFKKKYDAVKWRNNEHEFQLWCKGETGYPLIDAGMRQLNETGWMHNRVRMIVAGFLCKHLLIDWRWGEAYFAEKLLDYELASNNGNWQWAAGTGADAAPYFRIFNPHEQIKKFDSELRYVKKWIKNFRPGYLPEIVEHKFARKRALEVYKKALEEK
jgi:deoxyribodipyrimidine photo-lyase